MLRYRTPMLRNGTAGLCFPTRAFSRSPSLVYAVQPKGVLGCLHSLIRIYRDTSKDPPICAAKTKFLDVEDNIIYEVTHGPNGEQNYLISWRGQPHLEDTCLSHEKLQRLALNLLDDYFNLISPVESSMHPKGIDAAQEHQMKVHQIKHMSFTRSQTRIPQRNNLAKPNKRGRFKFKMKVLPFSLMRTTRQLNKKFASASANSSPTMSTSLSDAAILPGSCDDHGGVVVEMNGAPLISEAFRSLLRASISHWRQQGKKGVWLKLPIEHANLVQPAVESRVT